MKLKEFNKFGDTSFRIADQATAFINVANFLFRLSNEKNDNKYDNNYLSDRFIEWANNEGIYSYKGNEIKRFGMLTETLVKLNLIKINKIKNKNIIEINNDEIIKLINCDNPIIEIFNRLKRNCDFFYKAISFAMENNDVIDIKALIIAMELYDGNEKINDLYKMIKSNYSLVLDKIAVSNFKDKEINFESFRNFYKKKPNDENLNTLNEIFENKKCNREISKFLYKKLLKVPTFKAILSSNYFKSLTPSFKCSKKEIIESGYRYINMVNYEKFVIDIEKARNYKNLSVEYFDLNIRWFDNLNLIENKEFNKKMLNKNELQYIEIKNNFINYPYDLKITESYLDKIQKGIYDFKTSDKNLINVCNSTLAEYFINLYYSLKNNINPDKFRHFARTKVQPGTLYPRTTAPGNGPDMFHIINKKLRIIETTIHNTLKQVRNNEVFNVCDHINLNKLDFYLSKQDIQNINQTEIVLVSPLSENNFVELEQLIYKNTPEINISRKIKNNVIVTNFSGFKVRF